MQQNEIFEDKYNQVRIGLIFEGNHFGEVALLNEDMISKSTVVSRDYTFLIVIEKINYLQSVKE